MEVVDQAPNQLQRLNTEQFEQEWKSRMDKITSLKPTDILLSVSNASVNLEEADIVKEAMNPYTDGAFTVKQ